jgi:PAS domain S-box-containing protein
MKSPDHFQFAVPAVTQPETIRVNAEIAHPSGTDPFAAAVRATRMPMVISDPRQPDNPIVFANDSFCRLSGYAREEILGRNCRFLQGESTDPAAVARIRAAVMSEQAIEIDIRNYRKNGTTFWNRLLMAPVHDSAGRLAYFFASQVDVTLELDRLEGLETHNAALLAELSDRLRSQAESEARLQMATQAGRMGIWELDLATLDLIATPICRESFGRDPAAPFTYEDMKAAIHPADRPRFEADIAAAIASGAEYDGCRYARRCCAMRRESRPAWPGCCWTCPSGGRPRNAWSLASSRFAWPPKRPKWAPGTWILCTTC